MADTFRVRLGKLIQGRGGDSGPAKVSPFQEQGVSGTPIYGGYVRSVDQNARVRGPQRFRLASEIATNVSIVSAGLRYFLNLVAKPEWTLEPADESDAAKQAADLMTNIIHDMATPWPRIIRRNGMYRYHGFGIAEWTAKKRPDGKIGFQDIEQRPQHTIWRWGTDNQGSITGVWQRDPQTGQELWLPRSKILYLVDDMLTDSPEGSGWFRDLAEPYNRLKRFQELETIGYERNLAGTPIGRVPYGEIKAAEDAGKITAAEGKAMIGAMEDFVDIQAKEPTTSLVLDSATYPNVTEGGPTVSAVAKWGVELLKGDMTGIEHLGVSIDRLVHDMARIIGIESLLVGEKGSGSLALSKSKTENLYVIVNSTLQDMASACDADVIETACALNGIPDELRPHLKTEDVAFTDVESIAAVLRDMAAAGATITPDDPAVNDLRDLCGISHTDPATAAKLSDLALEPPPMIAPPGGVGPDGKPLPGKPGAQPMPKPRNPPKGKPKRPAK